MKERSKLLKGVGLFFLGIILLVIGVYLLKNKMEFLNNSVQVVGTIIDVESSRSNSTTYYYPVISFHTLDGTTYTFSSETGSSAAFDINKGDKISVRYTEENPQNAKVDSFMELWGLPLALLLAAIVLLLVGAGIVYKHFNKIPE
jgi:hypothetical protein